MVRKWKRGIVILAIQNLAGMVLIYNVYKRVRSETAIPEESVMLIIMDILCILIASFFSLSLLRSKRQTPIVPIFLWIIFFDVLHLFSDGAITLANDVPEYRIWTIAASTVYLICPLVMTGLYWKMLDYWMDSSERRYRWADRTIVFIAIVGTLLAFGNIPLDYYFGVTGSGEYYRGDMYSLTIIIPGIMVALCTIRILRNRQPLLERLVLLSYPGLPVIAAIAQHIYKDFSFLTIATFLSIVLVYTNFYSTRETELAEMEKRLTISKLHSLQMQINPHMLFNTMSSIAGMCDIDPEKSQDMIYKLSDYLRDNFTDIDKPNLITLQEELEQLDHYIAIETMRFPNIRVVKDIRTIDFVLPRMSLQPLVENAIVHGICKKRRAKGTLTIRSFETETDWVVSVEDDGVGFDGSFPSTDLKEHYGIYNVRTRLSILCGGTLEVTGRPGEGTVSTIKIPKTKKKERM